MRDFVGYKEEKHEKTRYSFKDIHNYVPDHGCQPVCRMLKEHRTADR